MATDVPIRWNESKPLLSPAEKLSASASFDYTRLPDDNQCLAVVQPLSDQAYSLAISVDAHHRFSGEVLSLFLQEANRLTGSYSEEEDRALRQAEVERGNPGKLVVSKPNLMRLLAPERILG